MSANMTQWMARLAQIGLGLVLLGQAESGHAGTLSTSSTRVSLSAKASTAMLTLRNEGAEDLRLQISAFDWRQSPAGEMQLQPTRAVLFFPALMTIRPGQERKVRIGSTGGFGAVEKPYRIFIEELPGGSGEGVRMRTRIGLPVFVGGDGGASKADVDDVRIAGDVLHFRLRNRGAAHLPPGEIRVEAFGAETDAAFDEGVKSWYVLPGGERLFDVTLPPGVCSRIESVKVAGRFAAVALEQTTTEVRGATCGPDGGVADRRGGR